MKPIETLILNSKLPHHIQRDINRVEKVCEYVARPSSASQPFIDQIHGANCVYIVPSSFVIKDLQKVLDCCLTPIDTHYDDPFAIHSYEDGYISMCYSYPNNPCYGISISNGLDCLVIAVKTKFRSFEIEVTSHEDFDLGAFENVDPSLRALAYKMLGLYLNRITSNSNLSTTFYEPMVFILKPYYQVSTA